jgi:hypothetical protein
MWTSVGANAEATCRIGVNGAPFGPDVHPGEGTDTTHGSAESSLTLTNVTDPNLSAGNHTIGLACNERIGDMRFDHTMVSAVVLGPG